MAPGFAQTENQLTILWKVNGAEKILKSLSLLDLKTLKHQQVRERDPIGQKLLSWRGPLLSELVESSLSQLPSAEEKAQIDLVILTNEAGEQAFIPRALITNYPVVLAVNESGGIASQFGQLYSVVPWTSKPKIRNEYLLAEKYFLPRISKIELANYRDRYPKYFLKRRTDPLAMRGEKLFVQTCLACHDREIKPARPLPTSGHPLTAGLPKFNEKDLRAFASYLEAHQVETPPQPATVTSTSSR